MTFYDLTFNDSKGNPLSMSAYKGKVVLIVNTATKCGLAPQFSQLEELYQKYKDRNFSIIGFPCSQFLNQETQSDESMESVCKLNFGVTFLLAQKIDVNGKKAHPIFTYLKDELSGGIFGKNIKWNFTKFLVTQDGKPFKRYAPTIKPFDIENDILSLLQK